MTSNWYKDTSKLQYFKLELCLCDIRLIQNNAFNHVQFNRIHQLVIIINQVIEIENGAFNGLFKLEILVLKGLLLVNVDYTFFERVSMTLKIVLMINVRTNMYNLIGGTELINLEELSLCQIEYSNGTITSNTITKLSKIKTLSMLSCKIEVIAAGAFDHLSRTLETILLHDNRLKTLPGTLFDALNITNMLSATNFQNNPWECTCDLLLIQRTYSKDPNFIDDICKIDNLPECQSTEPIASKDYMNERQCSSHYGTNFLRINFTGKFRIKFLSIDKFYVKNLKRLTFYLINFAIDSEAHCVRVSPKFASLTLTNQISAMIQTSCIIIYENAMSNVWPLNCVSFKFVDAQKEKWIGVEWKMYAIFAGIAICIAIFFGSLALGIFLVRKKLCFLRGVGRVHYARQQNSILILPRNWKSSQKLRSIKYGGDKCNDIKIE